MREIALDTETTGLSYENGDRITEIGCVEIIDKVVTGKTFHTYVNPECEVSAAATEISGLTYSFLKDYPIFTDVANEFLKFIGDAKLVIHNASFDIGFLNHELRNVNLQELKNPIVDTLTMARKKFPGSPATLDALCKRFEIDKSKRIKHGALIDAELLAHVYIAMSVSIKQNDIFAKHASTNGNCNSEECIHYTPRSFPLSEEECVAHQKLLETIKNPLWLMYKESK